MTRTIKIIPYYTDLCKYNSKENELIFVADTQQTFVEHNGKLIPLQIDFPPKNAKPKTYNCINCGAPLTSHTCEYCGTKYYS